MLAVIVVGLMLSGCMTIEDFGKGLATGGVGAASAPLVVAGAIIEIAGGTKKAPAKGEPGFEEHSKKVREAWMGSAIMFDMQQKITTDMTPDQAKSRADEYCDRIEKAVSTGDPLTLKREVFSRILSAEVLPDAEEFQHILKKDPVKGGCRSNFNKAAQHKLKLLQKNS